MTEPTFIMAFRKGIAQAGGLHKTPRIQGRLGFWPFRVGVLGSTFPAFSKAHNGVTRVTFQGRRKTAVRRSA
jgi:hypothetical protein